ncbi:hypothetical protein PVAP13_1NG145776 [Panicum virgatum]|uniref:Uncharacterized protein n=1 Tax=Panicum virgatum TaxID=38727 RepID=A0A8T0WUD3_PANVG|nr:hypothetical protein PVAP13_1NG145776 [Panicum virgatum]
MDTLLPHRDQTRPPPSFPGFQSRFLKLIFV